MEVVFNQKELDKALGAAKRATMAKGSLTVLSGILIEAVGDRATFSATNFDTHIQYKIPARAESSGKVLVSGNLLHDLVRRMPGPDVTLTLNDNLLNVQSGAADYKIVTMNPAEFPLIEKVQAETSLAISGDDLRTIYDYTSFAVAGEKGDRPMFTGINLACTDDSLVATGTNSHQLARKSIPFSTEAQGSIIIPPAAIAEVGRLTDPGEGLTLNWGRGKIAFQNDNLYFSCRAIEGQFPDVSRVIPQGLPTSITLSPHDLAMAIDRISLIATQRTEKVTLTVMALAIDGDVLTITANTPDKGQAREELWGKGNAGPKVALYFNGSQILDCLRAVEAEKITLAMPEKPGAASIVCEGDDSYIYVICSQRAA